jgi:drug/metabolite transporter (DMT)-like permease
VGASRWAVSAARPDAESTLSSETIGCAWATLLAGVVLLPRRSRTGTRGKALPAAKLRWFLAGAMIFGGPAVALFVPGRDLDPTALTIALALTPVMVALASSALGMDSSVGIAGRIWPSLTAVAAFLLVLVQPNLADPWTDLLLLLAPVLAGVGAALFCSGDTSTRARAPTTLLGASTLFAIALVASHVAGARPAWSLLAIACDGVVALLGITTLSYLGATRWSAQFTWIPLLIILEGIALVRPRLTAHWFTGLILLIIAGVYLLLPQTEEPSSDASPIPNLPI